MQWPHGKKGDGRWRIRLLQTPQELSLIDKTRNQFMGITPGGSIVLVDSAPQVMPLTMHGEKHLIQMPLVTRLGTPRTELIFPIRESRQKGGVVLLQP
jgi:hypothetical protein